MKRIIGTTLNVLTLLFPSRAGRMLFNVFCYPFAAKVKPFHLAFLSTAGSFELTIDGHSVRGYQWGSGTKRVFLVHGWRSNTFRWRDYVQAIDIDKYTIYAFDAPGHGLSQGKINNVIKMEKVLLALSQKFGPADAIIAHSIGAFATFYFIHNYPELQPSKLVSLAPPRSVDGFIDHFQRELSLSERSVMLLKNHFAEYVGHPTSYFDLSNFFDNITAQGLLIHDKDDKDTSSENSILIHEFWNASELHLTKGLGHKLRDPSIVDRIVEFL